VHQPIALQNAKEALSGALVETGAIGDLLEWDGVRTGTQHLEKRNRAVENLDAIRAAWAGTAQQAF
jgi:hypothetical protein